MTQKTRKLVTQVIVGNTTSDNRKLENLNPNHNVLPFTAKTKKKKKKKTPCFANSRESLVYDVRWVRTIQSTRKSYLLLLQVT